MRVSVNRTSRRAGTRSFRLVTASCVALSGVFGLVSAAASATSPQTVLTSSDFSGATVSSQWTEPGGTNDACLTAGTDTTQSPIPGCNLTVPDVPGNGVLQLTSNTTSQIGAAFSQVALPTSDGLDISFTTYQYNGTGSDGISFDLAATDPTAPSSPTVLGPNGGTLGYSSLYTLQGATENGLANGYLGIGLDVFGNFLSKRAGIGTCAGPGATGESISARGPGNGINGYCVQGTTHVSALSQTLDTPSSTTRSLNAVPVEIALNPSAAPVIAAQSGLSVPAKSWLIAYSPVGVSQTAGSWSSTYSLTGLLPTTLAGPGFSSELANTADFPSSWINPANGLPYLLTFGWSGSTGALTEIHDISVLSATTLTSTAPVLSVAATDNEGGHFIAGNRATFTLTPTVNDNVGHTDGSESNNIYLSDTFPTGITPGQPTSLDSNWNCPAPVLQTITCTYTVTTPIAPGTVLPAVNVPTTIDLTANGTLTDVVKVSSIDSASGVGSDTGTATSITTQSTPKGAPTGAKVTLSVGNLPSATYDDVITMKLGSKVICTFIYSVSTHSCSTTKLPPGIYAGVQAFFGGDAVYGPQVVKVPRFIVGLPVSTTLHYLNASSSLRATQKAQIIFFAKLLRKYHLRTVTVVGYTSSTGSAATNRVLSLARARQAAKYLKSVLASLHINGVNISTSGKGATQFTVSPHSSPKNRRTVFSAH